MLTLPSILRCRGRSIFKLTIETRLRLAFLAVVGLTAVLGVISLIQVEGLHATASAIGTRDAPSLQAVEQIDRLREDYRADQLRHVITTSPIDIAKVEADMADTERQIGALFATYRTQYVSDASDRRLLEEAQQTWNDYVQRSAAFLAPSRGGDQRAAFAILTGQPEQVFVALGDTLNRWDAQNQAELAAALAAADRQYSVARWLVLVAIGGVVLGGLALALWSGRVLKSYRTRTDAVLGDARQEADRARIFNQLSERVTFASDEGDLVRAAIAALQRMVSAPQGELLLLNPSLNRLLVGGVWGEAAREAQSAVDVERPDLCPGIRRGSTYSLADGRDDLSVHCAAHPINQGSLLCVPMLALGQTIGVLHVADPSPGAFSAADQQLVARVAERIALALANARLMRTMETQAMTDPLTRLPNPRFFDPLLERELAAAERDRKPLSVLMVDIDHFKKFNDTHGHPAGDDALRAFGTTLRGSLRESDTVARYGGEEFVVLLRHADLDAAVVTAEKLRQAVEQLVVQIGPARFARLTASFGVASTSAHEADRLALVRTADQALYHAKRLGRNRVVAAPVSVRGPVAGVRAGPIEGDQVVVPRRRARAQ